MQALKAVLAENLVNWFYRLYYQIFFFFGHRMNLRFSLALRKYDKLDVRNTNTKKKQLFEQTGGKECSMHLC